MLVLRRCAAHATRSARKRIGWKKPPTCRRIGNRRSGLLADVVERDGDGQLDQQLVARLRRRSVPPNEAIAACRLGASATAKS